MWGSAEKSPTSFQVYAQYKHHGYLCLSCSCFSIELCNCSFVKSSLEELIELFADTSQDEASLQFVVEHAEGIVFLVLSLSG